MINMVRYLLIAVALLHVTRIAAAQQVIRLPHSNHVVMIDGKLGAGEWDDAAQFSIGDVARGYIKQSGGYVWIAVERLSGDDFSLDFYLQASDRSLYDLHASAKIGERKLQGSSWSDHWIWWNNDRSPTRRALIPLSTVNFCPKRFASSRFPEHDLQAIRGSLCLNCFSLQSLSGSALRFHKAPGTHQPSTGCS